MRRRLRLSGVLLSLLHSASAALLRLGEATAFFGLFIGALELAQALFACELLPERPRLVQLESLSGEASLSPQVFDVIGWHAPDGPGAALGTRATA